MFLGFETEKGQTTKKIQRETTNPFKTSVDPLLLLLSFMAVCYKWSLNQMSATIKLLTYPKILEGAVRDFAVNYIISGSKSHPFHITAGMKIPSPNLRHHLGTQLLQKLNKNRFTLTPHSSIMLLPMAYVSDNVYSSASSTHPPFTCNNSTDTYILNPSTIESTKLQEDLLHTKTSQCLFAELDFI